MKKKQRKVEKKIILEKKQKKMKKLEKNEKLQKKIHCKLLL
jgi:hypothetical protein